MSVFLHDLLPYLACFTVLTVLFTLLPKQKRTRRAALALLLTSLICEVLVCNFHSFHLIGRGYRKTAVDLASGDVRIEGSADRTSVRSDTDGREVRVTLSGPHRPVGSVRLGLAMPDATDYVDVAVDATDETSSAYRQNVAKGRALRGDLRSSFLTLNLSGDVGHLRVRLRAAKGADFTLESLTLNEPVPFRLSALRLLLFVLGGLGLYALCAFPSMRATFGSRPEALRRAVAALTVALLIGSVLVTFVNRYDRTGGISAGFNSTQGDQLTRGLVDAFEAGQVSLLEEPSEELLTLRNAYDWNAREARQVPYLWDHLLYEGKYYSYYGVAPVILLFLPYHLLTGYYFPAGEAILLFGGLGVVCLSLLFLEFAGRFGRRVPNGMLLSTLIILHASSGVWFNFCCGKFYEIAQSSGFCFTCAGFLFLLRSGVADEGPGRPRLRDVVLSTLCLSLAVLCRPTLALYCVAALPFLAFGFRRQRAESERLKAGPRDRRRADVRYLFAALSCFALIGGAQMLYNYARFGSVLDFGIRYSLTINDFTRARYHTDFVTIGLFNFLLAFPIIKPEFPYAFSNLSRLGLGGFYYIATDYAMGLLWRAPPLFGYLGAAPAWRTMSPGERRRFALLVVPTCVLCPLVVLCSIWESGYGVRYACDFAWQLILGGAAVLFLLYARLAKGQTRDLMRRAFAAAAAVSVFLNGALLYAYLYRDGLLQNAYLRFERIFDFWL